MFRKQILAMQTHKSNRHAAQDAVDAREVKEFEKIISEQREQRAQEDTLRIAAESRRASREEIRETDRRGGEARHQ